MKNLSLNKWLIIIFLVNVLFRMINLNYGSYFLDEAANLWYYQQDYETVIHRSLYDANPPIYGTLIHFWIKIVGVGETVTRMFSVLALGGCASLLFLFARKFFTLNVALLTSFLFLFSDFVFHYAHAARPYALLCLVVTSSYFFLALYVQKRKGSLLVAYFLTSTAILYTHPTAVFNLVGQGTFLLLYLRSDFRMVLRLWTAILCSVLVYYYWYSISPFFDEPRGTWLELPTWHTIDYSIQILFDGYWLPLIFVLAGIILVVSKLKTGIRLNEKGRILILLGFWIVFPFLLNIIFSYLTKVSIFSPQYLISILPGFYFAFAIVLNSLVERFRVNVWMLGLPILLVLLLTLNFKTTFHEDWREAVAYVKINQTNETAVFLSPQFQNRSFAFYYNRSFYEKSDETFKLLDESNVYLERSTPIERLTEDEAFTALIFVICSKDFEHNVNLIELKAHHTLVEEQFFDQIGVFRFKLAD